MPGGRPKGAQNKDKPFKDALRIEAALAADGVDSPARKGSLRFIARQLLDRAGDDTASAREIADRFDGKPAQTHEGGEKPFEHIHKVITEIVDPKHGSG